MKTKKIKIFLTNLIYFSNTRKAPIDEENYSKPVS